MYMAAERGSDSASASGGQKTGPAVRTAAAAPARKAGRALGGQYTPRPFPAEARYGPEIGSRRRSTASAPPRSRRPVQQPSALRSG